MTEAKACSRCHETRPFEEFLPNARMRDGRGSWCRDCRRWMHRSWRERNPEKVAAYNESRRSGRSPNLPGVWRRVLRGARIVGTCSPDCLQAWRRLNDRRRWPEKKRGGVRK